MNSFLSNIDCYLRLSRNEEVTLTQLIRGIRISDIPWLRNDIFIADEKISSQESSLFKQQLLMRFATWLFSDFINALVGVCFYVTEAEGRGNETLFFRKPVWAELVKRGLHQMKNNFMPVQHTTIIAHNIIIKYIIILLFYYY